jgi:predicted outer membrane repeat protein
MSIKSPCTTCHFVAGVSLGASMSLLAPAHADAHLNGVAYPTIQQAVEASVPGDVIDVDPGTYTGGGDNVVHFMEKPIRIRSIGGANQTFIDGQGARRGVLMAAPENGPGGALLEGFTILNGRSSEQGGGVLMAGSAWLVDCRVIDSSAPTGGGVAAVGAYPGATGVGGFTGGFQDVVVSGNLANSDGGGVALLGETDADAFSFSLRGSVVIKENEAGGRGGGLFLDTCSLGMTMGSASGGLEFSGNESTGTGGGLHARNSVIDFDGSGTFECIENRSSSNGGGCALVQCPDVRLRNGYIGKNETVGVNAYGAGLWAKDSAYDLLEVGFEGNVAGGGGGGIRNRRSDAVVSACAFTGNRALGAGGGGFSSEESVTTAIQDCSFIGNHGDGSGGGIHMEDCDLLQLEGTLLEDNRALSPSDPDHTYGGGAYLQFTHLACASNHWSGNTAGYGGGLYSTNMQSVNGNTVSIIESDRFDGNEATYTSGGGIGLNGDGIYEVRSCEFTGNRSGSGASALHAGGNQGVTLEVLNSHFVGNGGSISDKAVVLMNATAAIRNSVFKDNVHGAVSTILQTTLEVTDSCFCNNRFGVANHLDNATVGIGGCRFAANTDDILGDWSELSMNFFMTFCPCSSGPDCDIDGDGVVDGTDLAALLAAWGTSNPEADLDQDGSVGGSDLAILLGCW